MHSKNWELILVQPNATTILTQVKIGITLTFQSQYFSFVSLSHISGKEAGIHSFGFVLFSTWFLLSSIPHHHCTFALAHPISYFCKMSLSNECAIKLNKSEMLLLLLKFFSSCGVLDAVLQCMFPQFSQTVINYDIINNLQTKTHKSNCVVLSTKNWWLCSQQWTCTEWDPLFLSPTQRWF